MAITMAAYANHIHTPTAITFAMANVLLNSTTWCSDEVTMDPFEGLSPFQFGTGLQDIMQDQQAQSVNLMMLVGANQSLANAQALTNCLIEVHVPISLTNSPTMLRQFHLLLSMLLPAGHPFESWSCTHSPST
jgi:hypothetical protein